MNQFMKMSAFAVATCLSASAFGMVITEDFSTDPTARGWSGYQNTTVFPPGHPDAGRGNDYGWRMTDDTGTAVNPPGGAATGAGEIGGFMNRAPNSFYGVNLGGEIDLNTTDMNVRGVLRQVFAESSSTLNLGWMKGVDTVNNPNLNPDSGLPSGAPRNALYVTWDDGFNGAGSSGMRVRNGTGSAMGVAPVNVPNLAPGGNQAGIGPTPFEFNWNSTTNTFSFTLGSNPTSNMVLTEDQVTGIGDLNHWALWGRTNNDSTFGGTGAHADNERNQLRIDDVTYTVVPEPASLGLLALGVTAVMRRRRKV